MSKFKHMDETDPIAQKIESIVLEMGLDHYMDIVPRYLAKPQKNNVGAVYKWNDVSATLTGNDTTVIVAVYGEAFDRVDEKTQDFWLRSLISQIEYDFDKDRIVINKDLLNIPLSVYQKYGEEAVKSKELEVHTLVQLAEEEKERKLAEKASKPKVKLKFKS